MIKRLMPLAIVVFFSILAGLPLLHSGLPPTHDGEYHVIRFYEFDKVLRDGVWYPRWAPDLNNGYGIPLFSFVYPLPNYVASSLHAFAISFIDSFKYQMAIAILVGALFFYAWTREFFGTIAGIVGSVLYTFSPYHFLDIYVRGSVGEVWALALFPAALFCATKFLKDNKKIYIVFSSVFLALVVLSHNILGLMFFIFYLFYIGFLMFYIKKFNQTHLFGIAMIILLSLSLSAIFWIPALLEKEYTRGLQIFDYSRHFPETYQLLIPSWGTGFSGDDLKNAPSYQIGLVNILAVLLGIIVFFIYVFNKDKRKYIYGFFLIWFFFIFFLMQRKSIFLWETIPFMEYFQFPWRFLSVEILLASFLGSSIFAKWNYSWLAISMVLLCILLGIGYTKPAYYHDRSDSYYISRSNFIDGTNSPGNTFNTKWMDTSLKKQKEKIVVEKRSIDIIAQTIKSNEYVFKINARKDSTVFVNTAFFPGWKAFIDNNEVSLHKTKEGIMSFPLQKGVHTVNFLFTNTPVRTLATSISVASFIIIFLLIARSYGTIKRS